MQNLILQVLSCSSCYAQEAMKDLIGERKVRSDLMVYDLEANQLSVGIPSSVWKRGANHPEWGDDKTIVLNLFDPVDQRMRLTKLDLVTGKYEILIKKHVGTGHPTLLDENGVYLTDSYFFRDLQGLNLFNVNSGKKIDLARFSFDASLKGPLRCDLHPRWNPNRNEISFDRAENGQRRLYSMNLGNLLS